MTPTPDSPPTPDRWVPDAIRTWHCPVCEDGPQLVDRMTDLWCAVCSTTWDRDGRDGMGPGLSQQGRW